MSVIIFIILFGIIDFFFYTVLFKAFVRGLLILLGKEQAKPTRVSYDTLERDDETSELEGYESSAIMDEEDEE